MQIYSRRFMQVGILIFMTIAFSLSAQATTYSVASLKGSYSFLVNRWTADVNTNQLAAVGVATFDGAGNVTDSYIQIYGGVLQTLTGSGTYTVKSNGTGTINWTNGIQVAMVLNSPAAGLAHGVQLLQTSDTNNEVESGTAWLQSTVVQTYSVASIKGNFAWQENLWTADPNQPQHGGVGTVTFDGKGNSKGTITAMNGGVLHTDTFTGTYSVSSDGTGSVSLTNGAQFAFVLNNKPTTLGTAKGVQFLQTNSGGNIVICGAALKQ